MPPIFISGVNNGMPRKKHLFETCVYKISFSGCDRVYIGSTTRWPYRRTQHLRGLKMQKHFNQFLQRASNKYGLETVLIEPIEFCSKTDELKDKEQHWIDFYDSSNPERGFNLVKIVVKTGTVGYKFTEEQRKKASEMVTDRMKDPNEREKISKTVAETLSKNPDAYGGKFKAKKFSLLNPSGELVEVENLNKFCRENNLDYKPMIDVANKKRKEYEGWKNPDRKLKEYAFIDPNGEIVRTTNLSELCRKENLNHCGMSAIHRGYGISYRGWKKYHSSGEIAKHKGKNYLVEGNTGEILQINNLTTFCRENNLCRESLRKGIQSKGFKLLRRI